MSTLVAGAIVATAMLSHCSWNSPGRNPYRGSVSDAVTRYVDIPLPVRTRLIAKIEGRQADDTVAIMRDSIAGNDHYDPQIADMHFGQRTVCASVARDGWSDTAREPAKVYCVDGHCLIVPQICGNISRVRRIDGASGGTGPGGAAAPAAVSLPAAGQPGWIRPAAPDDVAMADAMAQVASSGDVLFPSSSFMSPFGASTGARDLSDRNPGAGTELTQPAPVPEPATIGMLAAGLAVVFGAARRAGRKAR